MSYDIITIGGAYEDVFVEPEMNPKYDRSFTSGRGICFEFGEKIPLNAVYYEIGGSACNAAVGLSRLGFKTSLVSILGDDTPMVKVKERLIAENVDQNSLIISKKVQTGFSVIFSIDGERTIFVYHGVKDYSDLKIKKGIRAKWFFVTPLAHGTEDLEKRLIAEISEKGSLLAWNPGAEQIMQGASHYRHMLNCTSILFLNREEAIKFVDGSVRPQVDEAMKKLHLFGAKIVVVTNGKEGAKAYDGERFYEIKADERIKRVDATGAGDAFATGFLGKLIEANFKEKIDPNEIHKALKWGVKNSGSVVQYIGAQKGLLDRENISK